MAGPVVMALGPFPFQAHGFGFTGLQRSLDTSWAELETVGRLNALQWTGPKSEVVTISGVLFPREFGGQTTLDGIRLAAQNGLPLMLVSLGGRIFGRHAVQRVDEDRSFHDRNGTAGRNAYSLSLRRLSGTLSLSALTGVSV
ncbi:phage tail protein [Pseudooceanicola sp. CBS1P-1]|uniref:Oxidoreductase n=1 Tax=Pseudooceanicola albus TaxID=2692189 RepID=A0A6L7FYG9_9RHOB|nr:MULTISPECIES: phage tail protein [Pseudooceanicola]MBT9383337.1 phage tail protein [Pseudooceanicola endophyticus]MXN16340.1 oxidoreductase [Pseudooceanicola albus]